MPSYYLDCEFGKYIKQCSHCKENTVGTHDLKESIAIFAQMFSDAGPSSGMSDGFQSRCWICNASKRRSLGVTRPILEEMMYRQDGKCAICERKLSIARDTPYRYKAHVDHDETTNKVRELLCGDCNRGIGMFLHDPTTLDKASQYCQRHTSQVISIRRRV